MSAPREVVGEYYKKLDKMEGRNRVQGQQNQATGTAQKAGGDGALVEYDGNKAVSLEPFTLKKNPSTKPPKRTGMRGPEIYGKPPVEKEALTAGAALPNPVGSDGSERKQVSLDKFTAPPPVIVYTTSIGSDRKILEDCRRVIQLMDAKLRGKYIHVDLHVEPEKREMMESLSMSEAVPQVHYWGRNIGGWDELEALNDNSEFEFVFKEVLFNRSNRKGIRGKAFANKQADPVLEMELAGTLTEYSNM